MKATIEISPNELFDILNSDGPEKKDVNVLETDLLKKKLMTQLGRL